jgi:predicted lipid-binding transport protein (Tim44 family)
MGGAVPLSEHEQRQLEQIEQALYADYPKLAQAVRAKDPRIHYKRRVVQAAIGFLLGVGLLLAGVVSKVIFIGVGGFVVMLACAMWALTSWRHMGGAATGRAATGGTATGRAATGRAPTGRTASPGRAPAAPRGRKPRKDRRGRSGRTGFMERLEERWRRRQQGDR